MRPKFGSSLGAWTWSAAEMHGIPLGWVIETECRSHTPRFIFNGHELS